MPLDPQVIKVMENVAALGLPAAHTVSPEEARANARKRPVLRGLRWLKLQTEVFRALIVMCPCGFIHRTV